MSRETVYNRELDNGEDNIENDAHMVISVILYSMGLVLGLLVLVAFYDLFKYTNCGKRFCQYIALGSRSKTEAFKSDAKKSHFVPSKKSQLVDDNSSTSNAAPIAKTFRYKKKQSKAQRMDVWPNRIASFTFYFYAFLFRSGGPIRSLRSQFLRRYFRECLPRFIISSYVMLRIQYAAKTSNRKVRNK